MSSFSVIVPLGLSLVLSLWMAALNARLVKEMEFVVPDVFLPRGCVDPFNGKIFFALDNKVNRYDGNFKNEELVNPGNDDYIRSIETYLPHRQTNLTSAAKHGTHFPMLMLATDRGFALHSMQHPFKKYCSTNNTSIWKPAYSKLTGKIYLANHDSRSISVLNSDCKVIQTLGTTERFPTRPIIDTIHNLIFQPFYYNIVVDIFQGVVSGHDRYVNSISFYDSGDTYTTQISIATFQPREDAIAILLSRQHKLYSISIPMDKIMSGQPFTIDPRHSPEVFSMPPDNPHIWVIPDKAYERDYILSLYASGGNGTTTRNLDLQFLKSSSLVQKERWSRSEAGEIYYILDGILHPQNHCLYISISHSLNWGAAIFKVCPRPNRR